MKNFDINKQIGDNLRAERNRAGLSQEGLAELSGLQRQHISKIENGLIDLIPILNVLNLKFEELYQNK